MAFGWVTLHVTDLAASVEFYEQVVGLTVTRRFMSGLGKEIVFLGDGETEVELIDEQGQAYASTEQISLGFTVDDVDKKYQEIEQSKVKRLTEMIQPSPTARFFYVADPSGVRIQFAQKG